MLETRSYMEEKRLPREFFTRDGLTVAKELLGKVLVHETSLGTVRGMITEVEAYMGVEDKGSHTYDGRRTERTEPMFLQGGNSYVYFTYGMYYCMNITTGIDGDPQAVLIRSVMPLEEASKEKMLALRVEAGRAKALKKVSPDLCAEERIREEQRVLAKLHKNVEKHLADGPGKMCLAMGITKAQNAVDMIESKVFYVTEGVEVIPQDILTGKRIGIDYAEEAADYLWRFFLK